MHGVVLAHPGRRAHVPSLLATGTLARLPIGINGLAVVLLLQDERGSFGIAGLAAGALALETGVGTPLMARVVDRTGPRVLGLLAILCAIGLARCLAVAASTALPAAVVPARRRHGSRRTPVSSLLRSLYPKLLRGRPELIHGTFALDSVLTEMLFIAGPALTAAIAVLISPGAALVVSAGAVTIGTFSFLAVLGDGVEDAGAPR